VRKITKKKGVDVVFEHVGAETFNGSLLCLKRRGRLVTCGSTWTTATIHLMQLSSSNIASSARSALPCATSAKALPRWRTASCR